jgi:integrase
MAKIDLLLDPRTKSESRMIKVRVTHQRKQRYFDTDRMKYTETEYAAIMDPKSRKTNREKRIEFKEFEAKAEKIASKLGAAFSFDRFKKMYYSDGHIEKDANMNLYEFWEQRQNRMLKEDRIGSYKTSKEAMNSWKNFSEYADLTLLDVDLEKLQEYVEKRKNAGVSITSINIHLRELRALINEAIKQNRYPRDLYPFENYTFEKSGNIAKKEFNYLTTEEIKMLQSYDGPDNEWRDLALFIIFANGLNPKDLLSLRIRDYDPSQQTITFRRQKTSRTAKADSNVVVIDVDDILQPILNRIRQHSLAKNAHLFDYYQPEWTPMQKDNYAAQWNRNLNAALKRICKVVGIDKQVQSYTLRHSFAFIYLVEGSGSIYGLAQSLGDTVATTERAYGKRFPQQSRLKIRQRMVAAFS